MTSQRVDIRLLGGVTVAVDGDAIQLTSRHALALLALLALRPQPRSRDALVADLWPDSRSASYLRQSLWLVRSALVRAGLDPDSLIEADNDLIGLRENTRPVTDAERFELLARGADRDIEAAVALYAGDLAQGFDHECFSAERERLADIYEDSLAELAELRLAGGDMTGARRAAESLIARDPLREEAHGVLIAIYGRSGSRSQVVRQWRRLTGVLRRELDVEPLPETEVTYRAALATTLDRSRRAVAAHVLPLQLRRASGSRTSGGLRLAPTG
jgi:DNA-binding SARP family transcriptional activator